jgi:hypothetical protein
MLPKIRRKQDGNENMKRIIIISLLSILIVSCKDKSIGKNYEFDYNPNEEINLVNKQKSENGYDIISISGHILFYGHSKEYIIVIQKPQDSIYKFTENLKYDEMMKKVFESDFTQLWILKVENDSLCGPFQKAEYLKKRKAIGIPDNLKINYSTEEFYLKGQRKDIQYKNPDLEVVDIKNLKGLLPK